MWRPEQPRQDPLPPDRQSRALNALKRLQASELLRTGIAAACFEDVDFSDPKQSPYRTEMTPQGLQMCEPTIGVATGYADDRVTETFMLTYRDPEAGDEQPVRREVVVMRKGGKLEPDARYDELDYSLVVRQAEGLRAQIDNKTLNNVDRYRFTLKESQE